jgi:hypothetical protein
MITDRTAMLDAIGEVWLQWKPTWNEMLDDIENATDVRLGACEDKEGEVDLFETLTDEQVRQVMEYVQRTPQESPEARLRSEIAHRCDGPITPFVLIARACDGAAAKPSDATALANALYEELCDRGWLVRDAIEETGS